MADPFTTMNALGTGASILSGFGGGSGKTSRAKSERWKRQQSYDALSELAPYQNAGDAGLGAYMNALGLGGSPSNQMWQNRAPATAAGTAAGTGATAGTPAVAGNWDQRRITDKNDWWSDKQWENMGYSKGTPAVPATGGYKPAAPTAGQTMAPAGQAPAGQAPVGQGGDLQSQLENFAGYQFARDEALGATERAMAARGMNNSGNLLAELQGRAAGLASQNANNFMDRLAGMADMGSAASGNRANIRTDLGSALANIRMGGSAQSQQRDQFQMNALNNGIQGGIENTLLNNYLKDQGGGGMTQQQIDYLRNPYRGPR